MLQEKKRKLFQVGFEVGGNLLNRVWRPNQALQAELDSYLSDLFDQSEYYMIGIQLRFGSKEDSEFLSKEIDTFKFINCAIKIENEYLRTEKKRLKRIRWFVASDSDTQLKRLLDEYPAKVVSTKGKLAHVGFNADAYRRAIIDTELLGRCDELIITGGSTFGWIAAMKTLRLPYYINGLSKMRECERVELSRLPVRPKDSAVF